MVNNNKYRILRNAFSKNKIIARVLKLQLKKNIVVSINLLHDNIKKEVIKSLRILSLENGFKFYKKN